MTNEETWNFMRQNWDEKKALKQDIKEDLLRLKEKIDKKNRNKK